MSTKHTPQAIECEIAVDAQDGRELRALDVVESTQVQGGAGFSVNEGMTSVDGVMDDSV
jgi:hypothetical protein